MLGLSSSIAPFSIVVEDGKYLVVLSNDNGRLRLYDPKTSTEYPSSSFRVTLVLSPERCAGGVLKSRHWLRYGEFCLAQPECSTDQALAKLAWFYTQSTQSTPSHPLMKFDWLGGGYKPAFAPGHIGFFDRGGMAHVSLMPALWSLFTIYHLGIQNLEEALPHYNQFQRKFLGAMEHPKKFSPPCHKSGDLPNNTIVLFDGIIGYLADHGAPVRSFVPAGMSNKGGDFSLDPHALVHVLMTPSQNAHAVLRFNLTN